MLAIGILPAVASLAAIKVELANVKDFSTVPMAALFHV